MTRLSRLAVIIRKKKLWAADGVLTELGQLVIGSDELVSKSVFG